ncbi:MAG: DUF3048 domain-containing protein [bacterium]|nr:DUF3048 domain-containing protein [bacterium]
MKKLALRFKKLTKKQILILSGGLIVVFAGALGAFFYFSKSKKPEPEISKAEEKKPEQDSQPTKYYAALSGLEVDSAEKVNAPVIGVMIENSPNARPQSGLAEAEVVFEAIAEGGITRFLALYQQNHPDLIGPVRSLRTYYLDWVSGFDAGIAHVGGSGDALARVRDGSHRDLDQFRLAGLYWRASDRRAPHNVYTTFENLANHGRSQGWNNSNFEGFAFKEDSKSESPNASQIQIVLSGAQYNTFYNYNGECNCYSRGQAGAAHLDREKGYILPKNVVALKMDMTLGADGLHNYYSTIGSGAAVIFRDGNAEVATWQKESESAPLKLKNANGEDVKLNRGQTWLVAVPNDRGIISYQ